MKLNSRSQPWVLYMQCYNDNDVNRMYPSYFVVSTFQAYKYKSLSIWETSQTMIMLSLHFRYVMSRFGTTVLATPCSWDTRSFACVQHCSLFTITCVLYLRNLTLKNHDHFTSKCTVEIQKCDSNLESSFAYPLNRLRTSRQ